MYGNILLSQKIILFTRILYRMFILEFFNFTSIFLFWSFHPRILFDAPSRILHKKNKPPSNRHTLRLFKSIEKHLKHNENRKCVNKIYMIYVHSVREIRLENVNTTYRTYRWPLWEAPHFSDKPPPPSGAPSWPSSCAFVPCSVASCRCSAPLCKRVSVRGNRIPVLNKSLRTVSSWYRSILGIISPHPCASTCGSCTETPNDRRSIPPRNHQVLEDALWLQSLLDASFPLSRTGSSFGTVYPGCRSVWPSGRCFLQMYVEIRLTRVCATPLLDTTGPGLARCWYLACLARSLPKSRLWHVLMTPAICGPLGGFFHGSLSISQQLLCCKNKTINSSLSGHITYKL